MRLTLTDRKAIAEGTMAFWFRPVPALTFTAGQFGDFTLTDPPRTDRKGNTRTFSLASSPSNDQIMITTRLRDSAFKESLRTIRLGTAVEFMGPMGSFTLHKDASRPAVFLTGGIGITPVRSIVEHATQAALEHKLFVFYSNRTRATTAFLEDFQAWGRHNPNLKFIPTLTAEERRNGSFERGIIDEAMLKRHLPDLKVPVYYVVGPPAMVTGMKELLASIGLDELQIRSEDFAGY